MKGLIPAVKDCRRDSQSQYVRFGERAVQPRRPATLSHPAVRINRKEQGTGLRINVYRSSIEL
jgi:hypothetical protein